MRVFKIKGVIQNYAWGGSTFIPGLIGESVESHKKYAEYWMGAHDKAPSIAAETGVQLNDLIATDPDGILGEQVYKQFGRLPFLFKVLDVNDMLSIQVHPTKVEAEKGFERENQAGIPLSAPHRNYKDDNHKPEIMVAISDFWLLHGFKPHDELLATLKEIKEFNHLVSVFEEESYKGLYRTVMEESDEDTQAVLKPLIDRILPEYHNGNFDKYQPSYWAAKAFLTFCSEGTIDKGIYSIFFFNIVKVGEGEAVFQAAGIPHAYLEGKNLELMANSDNVLRGGLTPKHVDVEELMKHISFKETRPEIVKGELQIDGIERIYKSPAPDFELSKINLGPSHLYQSQTAGLELLIVLKGDVLVQENEISLTIKRGEVVAATANTTYSISSTTDVEIYKAKCPIL